MLTLGLAACAGDETISGFLDPEVSWQLSEIDGTAFPARATIRFPQEGRFQGQAPCNGYFGTQTAPYPWIEIGPIGASRRACSELEAEVRYFEALRAMSLAEVLGDVLILTGEDGREMVFTALPGE